MGTAGGTGRQSPGRRVRSGSRRKTPLRPLPSREEIQALPPFERLSDDAIRVVEPDLAAAVAEEIAAYPVVGFDTESKPVFVRGQTQDGPHLVQFAVAGQAWLFSMHDPRCVQAVGILTTLPALWKVGFGLDADRMLLNVRLGKPPVALIDLDSVYRRLGYRHSTGIRMAVALTFGRYFEKSKTIGKSDWSRQPLSAAQYRYAAHDAWGAFRIHQELAAQGVEIVPDHRGGAIRR